MNKLITFILSGSGEFPCGGFRIVYEYANRLSQRGWQVNIVHPAILWDIDLPIKIKLRRLVHYLRRIPRKRYLPTKWFNIDKRIKMIWVYNLKEKNIPDSQIIVACPAQSAYYINQYSEKKGRKFYFIQGFEDWALPKDYVLKTWKMPLKKLVISKWLNKIATDLGEKAVLIPNGIDNNFFKEIVPFSKRNPHSILFIYHDDKIKGSEHAIGACALLKQRFPDIIVTVFGLVPRPETLPLFISYHQNPLQTEIRNLYNSTTIFMAPNLSEGWGLPLCEALLCGCAAVATDINGHQEFMVDGINGILCRPGSVNDIVDKTAFLINNQEVAKVLAGNARQSILKFNWDNSVDRFEAALLE